MMEFDKQLGVITIAIGARKYIDQALDMARSVRLTNPGVPLAIVTDSKLRIVEKIFDVVVPMNPDFGPPFQQKVSIDLYTPFGETIFVDSDCLVAGELNYIKGRFPDSWFGLAADWKTEGHWFCEIGELRRRFNLEEIPESNSSVFYFRSCAENSAFFDTVRKYYAQLEEVGVELWRGQHFPDEPAFSLAMVEHGIRGIKKDFTIQTTTVTPGYRGLEMDILNRKLEFDLTRMIAKPVVGHFVGFGNRLTIYRRECFKLRLRDDWGLPVGLCQLLGRLYATWIDLSQRVGNRLRRS